MLLRKKDFQKHTHKLPENVITRVDSQYFAILTISRRSLAKKRTLSLINRTHVELILKWLSHFYRESSVWPYNSDFRKSSKDISRIEAMIFS